jgi:hypothetical protein
MSGAVPTAGADRGSDLSGPAADGIDEPGIGIGGGGSTGRDVLVPEAGGDVGTVAGGGVASGAGAGGAPIGGAGGTGALVAGLPSVAGGIPGAGAGAAGVIGPAGGIAPGCGAHTPP